ncbi:MAG: type II CRISPR RNA-guided endonuclease Cas9 [Asticcacaulis sp.]
MAQTYRFAFDLGTNSIGWAVYLLNQAKHPADLVDAGVRIFSDGRDPKSGASLAENRRGPRAMRRRRDRYVQRRTFLMDELIKAGLMPAEEAARKALETLDPYVLRRKGLYEALPLHAFGRALFHLNQRRGFQSNRIADAGNDEDGGKIKKASDELKARLKEEGCETYGEYLAKRHDSREQVRIRLIGKDAKAHYDFYPTRDILKDEFRKLWKSQAEHHPELTRELETHLFDLMFFQRPLKPPPVGKCTFFPEEERLAKAHPLSQARRIYQDLNHLRLIIGDVERPLSQDERDKLAYILLAGEDVTFKTGLRKHLGVPPNTTTSLEESGKTDRLVGDQVVARLGHKKGPLSKIWGDFNPEQRADIALRLTTEQSEDALLTYLTTTYGLSEETARAASAIRLPDGHDRLGLTATKGILEALKAEIITYDKAVKKAFPHLHHSDERDGVIHDALPYYGEVLERHTLGGTGVPTDAPDKRYGRLSNPTVHVALNQLRRVINALLKTYGHPEQIVIEVARDLKLSKKQKDELEKKQKANEKERAENRRELEEAGYADTPNAMLLMRLWKELGPSPRVCIYTGRPIGIHQLLRGEVEIEHILPYSRTLDDTFGNKTLAHREANRVKRNKAPGESYDGLDYDAIRDRARVLPANKRWRFERDAMEKFNNEERDFLARQLNETRHLATLARKYLVGVCNNPNEVRVVTGQLTALLRQRLGLNGLLGDDNRKNRTDHRHHAIDACVIGITERSLLNQISRQAGQSEGRDDLKEIVGKVEPPFEGFRDRAKAVIDQIIVSHKPEHGTGGALHNDTNYGIVTAEDRIDGELVVRKAIDALTYNEIDKVRDLTLRDQLLQVRYEAGKDAKALMRALEAFGKAQEPPIRRVRILKKQEDFVMINNRQSRQPYRAVIPGENHHIDIIETTEGKWLGFAATLFEANQKNYHPKWKSAYPDARLVMKVHKGDMLRVDDSDGITRIKRIVRLSPSNNILYLVSHNEGGEFAKRHDDATDVFRWDFANITKLRERNCAYVSVSETGMVTFKIG